MRFVILFLLLPLSALAQGFDLLQDDVLLTRKEVAVLTHGQHLRFYEGGVSRYSVGGAYSYSYASGATAYGRFDITEDGRVCVIYRNGRDRCDRFVRSHGRIVLLTEDGGRYPIRP